MESNKRELSPEQSREILEILKSRFEKNMVRHKEVDWDALKTKLEANKAKLWSLYQMEATGGEPDVIVCDEQMGEYTFFDCSLESPKGRRSVCYDHKALEQRKENKPKHSAVGMASDMGVDILTEAQYRQLQTVEIFDSKTSSWVETPDDIRELGGAIFCDRRYNTVFVYHNGAESYYSSRGFRASLKV